MSFRLKHPHEIEAEKAEENRMWPGDWQTDRWLNTLRKHIPELFSDTWPAILVALGPENTHAVLKSSQISMQDIEMLPVYVQELLKLSTRHPDMKAEGADGWMRNQLIKQPFKALLKASKYWNDLLRLNGYGHGPENLSWPLPMQYDIELPDCRITACACEMDIYRAIRMGDISPYSHWCERLIHRLSNDCLWHHGQMFVISWGLVEGSVLMLKLVADADGYRYEKVWHRPLDSAHGSEIFGECLDRSLTPKEIAAQSELLARLNTPVNQEQLKHLYETCETRRAADGDQRAATLSYLLPILQTLPQLETI